MAKILKPYEAPLEAKLAKEILNVPMDSWGPEDTPVARTVGERVDAATRAVKDANDYLAKSALANLVADTLMRKLKKRGVPSIRVRPDGTVVLHVSYDEEERPKAQPAAVARSSRKSDLPKLEDLRKEAEAEGIDISDLGQKRRAIFDRIKIAREASSSGDPKPPDRMIDEAKETEAPVHPAVIRRPRAAAGGSASEDLDVDDLLTP